MFRNGLIFRIIGALLLLGLVGGGIFMAFKAGEASGISQAPAVATAISQAAENGQAAPVPPMVYSHPYPFGYGYPIYGYHHFGFFPGGICLSILFIFLLLGFMKMIFFRRMMWGRHGGHHGPWGNGKPWEGGAPSMFDEWHKRAHGEKPSDEADKKE